ncbi:hypothetical protein ElyMa_006388000 [Elysia marginata]|uniref:Uncharacterized protein n=1 Tax=Elysia marginata TaxID=1093978 RepID=A0AAV4HP93_9GAST|nr:hypothetical protein ElyMa_006388000 [Elysia marginata]
MELSTTSVWDIMHENYMSFHSALTAFVNNVLGRLKPGSPPELQYMPIILDLMPTDDPDLRYQNQDEVTSRSRHIFGLTDLLLRSVRPYVQDSQLDWFDEEARVIRLWMSLVFLTLSNLRIAEDTDQIDYYKAGIGDINVGVDSYRPVNLDVLRELVTFLEQK